MKEQKIIIKKLLNKLNINLNDLDLTNLTIYLLGDNRHPSYKSGELVFNSLNGL